MFDITFIGHYTQDTIVYPNASKTVDGGAYYFGASVAARMGCRTAVITRLAREDWGALQKLESLGVTMLASETPLSTHLRITYPTDNLDQRTIEMTGSAGPFTLDQIAGIESRVYAVVSASARGEVPPELVQELAARGGMLVHQHDESAGFKANQVPSPMGGEGGATPRSHFGALLGLDVQGFVRVMRNGKLGYDDWPGKESVLPFVTVLKTDSVEAEMLTGEADYYAAARRLGEFGPREVLLTHSRGVLVYHDGVFDEAPFVPDAIRGRSGRGDTCHGAYLCRRLVAPPADAVVWAAAVTSLKLEKEGAFDRDLRDVEALYQKLKMRR